MAVMAPNKPVTQADPFLLVENQLAPGRYRFQLVAIDTAGLESAPAEIVVTVNAPPPPPPTPTRPPIFRPDIIGRVLDPGLIRPIRRPTG